MIELIMGSLVLSLVIYATLVVCWIISEGGCGCLIFAIIFLIMAYIVGDNIVELFKL